MIAIVNYNAGNIFSVQVALERLGMSYVLTDDPIKIQAADKVIFPGVGAAGTAMRYLREKELDRVIRSLTQPVLGICLGLQLLCDFSEESNTTCLGVFDVTVKRFPPKGDVPHMGWNSLLQASGPLFQYLQGAVDVYFVHSYYAEVCSDTVAVCDYLLPFSAALQRKNFYATQFHPEKSGDTGALILNNFLAL